MKPSDRFRGLVDYWAWRAELPADLVWRQVDAESAFNPRAVSPCGAMGLLQLMPETSREMGCMEPFNPDENLKAGTAYLAKQLANVKITVVSQPVAQDDLYRFALVSYNAGFGYSKVALRDLLAGSLPLDWPHFKATFPQASVRGRKPDAKQALGYAEKILPPGD